MLSRTLYEAFRSISSGVYSDGRPIPPWGGEFSPAVERDEGIWGELATIAAFAIETTQALDQMLPGSSAEVGGVFAHRTVGVSPYQLFTDSSTTTPLGRGLSLAFAVELIVRRRVQPGLFPPLPESAA